jgi:hypothetical protein
MQEESGQEERAEGDHGGYADPAKPRFEVGLSAHAVITLYR